MTKWCGKHYTKHSVPQEESAYDALDSHTFGGTEQVLDVGCGDGRVTATIAELVPNGQVLGIDNSQDMIGYAQELHHDIQNLTFQKADIQILDIRNTYDLIVSFSTLHWIRDQRAALNNMYNALHPGGRLLIRTTGGENRDIATIFNDPYWKQQCPIKGNIFYAQSADVYHTLLTEAGFKNITITSMDAVSSFSNAESLAQWLMAWVPYATGLSHNKSQMFTNAIVDRMYTGQKKSKDRSIDLVTPLLHIEAQK
ncbi:class I SAM-dependent methyltransferase [Candidatus Babeliales bacterium]|nr:class I SAM-dependent methyltransferase [Candidatus Babeliales bacterium]